MKIQVLFILLCFISMSPMTSALYLLSGVSCHFGKCFDADENGPLRILPPYLTATPYVQPLG